MPEIKEILERKYERTHAIRGTAVNDDDRTVDLAFSSAEPVEHWFGYLALSHEPGAAKLDRLTETGALLWNHNSAQQIGAVTDVRIDGKMGRATVKFSNSTMGEENFRDVKDGIKRSVSFGFQVNSLEREVDENGKPKEIDGMPAYRSDDWEPYEISLVSIPADISVGVGRSSDAPEKRKIQTENQIIMADKEKEIPVETAETRAPAVNETVQRVADFVEFGKAFGEEDLARTIALNPDATIDGLRAAIAEKRQKIVETPVSKPETIAERSGQQIARVKIRHATLRNFSGEGAEERAYRFGRWLMGGPLGIASSRQFCIDNGLMIRAQTETVNEAGGYLVPEEFGNDMIDLREQYGVFRRNAKVVPMASDTRSDPRRTGGLTAYFVSEAGSGTVSTAGWDRVSLTAKKLMVLARYSSEVNEDAAISFGDTLAGEIAYAFANKEDECGFNGDGTSTYGGIVGVRNKLLNLSATRANISGLHVGAGNAFSELVLTDFEAVAGKLPVYADNGMAKWYCHKKFYFNVMVKLMLAAGGVTAQEIQDARNKNFMGYPVEFVQVMPKAEANDIVVCLLGDLSMAASLGTRRDTTIALSEHVRFETDELEIRGTERFDINVHDVGDTNATAADQIPGPIVGLLMAAS